MRAWLISLIASLLITTGCAFETPTFKINVSPAAGRELFCAAESRTQAEEIAGLYGIELVAFDWGIATFHTEEDPLAVIERGRENGWILLDVNTTKQLLG